MFNKNLYDNEDLLLCDEYDIDIEAGEILTEFATVARASDLNICVAVNPDSKRNLYGAEYFKIYNHYDPTRASKIARIKFRSPDYVIHTNSKGMKNWVLNSKEIGDLMKLLKRPCKKHSGFSVWQGLILDFNYETGLDYEKTKVNKEVEEDKKVEELKYPEYLPIDLKIPNYQGFLFEIK